MFVVFINLKNEKADEPVFEDFADEMKQTEK